MSIYSLYDKEITSGFFSPKVYAYYFTEWKGFVMKTPHVHPWMEIMYVVNGKCQVKFSQKSISMKSGEFIFISSDISHRLVVEGSETCRMLNVEFGFEKNHNSIFSMEKFIHCNQSIKSMIEAALPYMLMEDFDEVYPIMKSLIVELGSNQKEHDYLIQLFLQQLLIVISRLAGTNKMQSSYKDIYVRKAIRFMNLNYDCPILIQDIADDVMVHQSYLQRIFKTNTGFAMGEYLSNIRIEKAKMLLERTDIPIIDISGYVGINSRQYFSTVFKKHTGFSPIQFRKNMNKRIF